MESHARFDLTTALARWPADLAARGNLEPGKIAELESHLRDSIADLQQRGLDDAEAFLIATRRLGSPAQIEEEFEKGESTLLPRRALWWLILGVAGWTTLWSALGVLDFLLAMVGSSFANNQATFAAFIGATKLLSLGLFAWVLLAVGNPHARVHAIVKFIACHPWFLVGSILLSNGLVFIMRAILFRQVAASRAGEFMMVYSYSSMVSSVASLAIIAFILAKVRPAQLAN